MPMVQSLLTIFHGASPHWIFSFEESSCIGKSVFSEILSQINAVFDGHIHTLAAKYYHRITASLTSRTLRIIKTSVYSSVVDIICMSQHRTLSFRTLNLHAF